MPTRRTFDKAEFLPNDNSTPHIVPGVLYPAIGGKLLDGTTSHSGNYGTSQSDSRKYYYTDIKGSRPIRDPRIGAHFGSQRHKFKSLQLLEQETATHGQNVYSVDGREWLRIFSLGESVSMQNDDAGHYLNWVNHFAVEIVGYFNQLNMICLPWTDNGSTNKTYLDGSLQSTTWSNLVTAGSPLAGRYVDGGSLINISFDSAVSLGIHTIRIEPPNNSTKIGYTYGCELIAQDTTNAVTRNKIQIPSQTVFSFGSKFTVGGSSAATHYDPFSARSDGTGWTSPTSGTNNANSSAEWPSNIDTATSLGLAKWVDGTNYYRPYNGGRVVKWVDENGEIKTSVTVMPPNAKSFANSGTLSNAAAKSNGSAPNDNFRPTFEAHTADVGVDEDLLSEVAKSYYSREFGNGSVNGNASYADASTLSDNDAIAYVMDDGLTSFSSDNIERNSSHLSLTLWDANDFTYITFIGTGITVSGDEFFDIRPLAQNLPYGTHILNVVRDSNGKSVYSLDGVSLFTSSETNYGEILEVTFHQPKMPPIPEGACIIADYMLMADFVPQTSNGLEKISKGTRLVSCSRDVFFDAGGSFTFQQARPDQQTGFKFYNNSGTSQTKLPFFGAGIVHKHESNTGDGMTMGFTNDGTNFSGGTFFGEASSNQLAQNSVSSFGVFGGIHSLTLGTYIPKFLGTGQSGKYYRGSAYEVITPIHTSHHYKSFETPFLHELIGGDRNMEQTHLICSADGKTWDEVTRDKSYLGPRCSFTATRDGGHVSSGNYYIFDYFRGVDEGVNYHNKGFAIGYDRILFLEDGYYRVFLQLTSSSNGGAWRAKLRHNAGDHIQMNQDPDPNEPNSDTCTTIMHAKRGDYFWVYVEVGTVNGTTRIRSRITAEKLD